LIVEYEVPIGAGTERHFALNWADGSQMKEDDIVNSFAAYKKREKKTPEISKHGFKN